MGYPQWLERGLPVAEPAIPWSVDPPPEATPGRFGAGAWFGPCWAIFFGGMALNLTPCVYPIIPVTVSYFAGQSDQAPVPAGWPTASATPSAWP